jgi:hypothetical protein
MKSNIVYQYFKREEGGVTTFIQVDPIRFKGSQLIVTKNGEVEIEQAAFEYDIIERLTSDGFLPANALEFHIILNGLS